MLTRRTKYLLKLMRGWSSAEVSRYYGVAESTVSKQTYQLPPTPVLTKQPRPLYSGEHYANLCWLRLLIDEGTTKIICKQV